MHNKKLIKFVAIALMSMLICSFSSVISFAEEVPEVRYATSEDVNLVFSKYLNSIYFTPLSCSDTVTKSKLYNNLLAYKEEYSTLNLEDKLPIRIALDLKNYPNDLITEDDLFMYLDELERADGNKVNIDFDCGLDFWCSVILIMILFRIFGLPSKPEIPDYKVLLENINLSIQSIEERIRKK